LFLFSNKGKRTVLTKSITPFSSICFSGQKDFKTFFVIEASASKQSILDAVSLALIFSPFNPGNIGVKTQIGFL
jgi:hypothetical protein